MAPDAEQQKPTRRPMRRVALASVAVVAAAGIWIGSTVALRGAEPGPLPPVDGTVSIAVDKPVNSFEGHRAMGVGVDGLEENEIDRVWTPRNVEAMKSAGFGPVSYRLRTELGVKAWHWNPRGTWSEAGKEQGYWTSSSEPVEDYGVSYGYRLPRRGNTIDQGKNSGHSRLNDDDVTTFWKSNPYLDSHFTGQPDSLHPQWIMVEFPHAVPVDTVRFDWGTPYATSFKVQRWQGRDARFPVDNGTWRDFPQAAHRGTGGSQSVRVAAKPVDVQYLRILLTADSNTAPAGSKDIRDRLGVAVRELYIGQQQGASFVDHVVHRSSHRQTVMWTSSTDPWHRKEDLDTDYEHASFERLFASGLTRGEPMMVPVPALYGTPEDAAALARYLGKRGFPVQRVEVGEEPDGQLAQPEHYGALYVQMAAAMKAVNPDLQFGGPGYQTTLPDWVHWPDDKGVRSWTGRFVSYLRQRDAMEDFDFFSFEWYPFDDVCANPAGTLPQNPGLLAALLKRQADAGLPAEVPKVITEYGYSSFVGEVELGLPGAIVNAETSAMFLAMGGETSYFYGIEPNWVFQDEVGEKCDTSGNLMLFQFYDEWKIRPIATFQAARLVNHHWLEAGTGEHTLYSTTSDLRDAKGQALVTAYSVRRPDGKLAVLLFNKDPGRSVTVRLMQDDGGKARPLQGPLEVDQYSPEQYKWNPTHRRGNGGHPEPNDPPVSSTVAADSHATLTLPPYSISVALAPR
ncbi:discoidin domain-containing protein [Arthrobacter sp. Soil763]|uniref:discoidin domain-containing protein n=1 Tax=Arthrobacter sp. Soil763 TaxID=1736402 RepID=UPI0012F74225|nr:discoidin domain-containing protein [Arthrobacter sp. Soil763]